METLCEDAAEDRAQSRCDGPYSTNSAHVEGPIPDGEEIADAYVNQYHHSSAAETLNDSTEDEHNSIHTDSAQDAAAKEDSVGCQDYWLSSENV